MRIKKTDINCLIQNIAAWVFLNFTFNLLGLWFSKLLDKAGFNYLQSISNEFVKPLIIQSGIFIVIYIIAYAFLKNRKITVYIFTLFQFLIFHVIFIINLNSSHMLHFETSLDDWGLEYLSNMGQYFVDILYIYLPLEGIFQNGSFIPRNTGVFYLEWIFLVLIYFGAITWLSTKAVQFFFASKSNAIKSVETEPKIETVVEPVISGNEDSTLVSSDISNETDEENQDSPKAEIVE